MKVQRPKPSRRKAMEAAQYSAVMAQEFYNAFQGTRWQLFWANVEIAALCSYVQSNDPGIADNPNAPGAFADLEKAIDCWPANVEIDTKGCRD